MAYCVGSGGGYNCIRSFLLFRYGRRMGGMEGF